MVRFGKLLIRKVLRERGVLTRDRSFGEGQHLPNTDAVMIARGALKSRWSRFRGNTDLVHEFIFTDPAINDELVLSASFMNCNKSHCVVCVPSWFRTKVNRCSLESSVHEKGRAKC
jgi:hypothetical protein